MKLDDLRDKTKRGRWLEPGAMRFTLGVEDLRELALDIERELCDAKTKGYLQGVHEANEKRAIVAQTRDELPAEPLPKRTHFAFADMVDKRFAEHAGRLDAHYKRIIAAEQRGDARLAVLEGWKEDIAELCRLAIDRAAKQG